MSDLADALHSMNDSCPGYNKAKAYAHGPITEVFASLRLRRLLRNKHVTFQTVLGNVVVDSVANGLEITSVATDNDTATQILASQDEHNKMSLVRPHVMRKACEFGDSYLIVWPETDDDGNETGDIQIGYNDPRTVRILYSAEHQMRKRLAIKKWGAGKYVRVDLYYADKLVSYRSKQPGGRASSDKDFELFTPEGRESPEVENPYGAIPVFHFTTTMPGEYGIPEHKAFYPTQDKLNKLAVSHMAGVDYYSIPQRYALMEPGTTSSEAAEMNEDEFATSPDGQRSEHIEGEGRATFDGSPGSVWMSKGIRGYGEFSTADPKAFLDPAVHYLQEGATATSTPMYLFQGGDFPSGKALRTANAPRDKKTNARRLSFHSTWNEVYTFVLKLRGIVDAAVEISWAPIEAMDVEEIWDLIGKKQGSGVPVGQTLEEGGYKGDTVKTWFEDGEGNLPQRLAQLKDVASSLNMLAPVVAAGIIDQAVVQELIAALIKDVTGDVAGQ